MARSASTTFPTWCDVAKNRRLFAYLSPLILPLVPGRAGATHFSLNLANALEDVAGDPGDAEIACRIQVFVAGEAASDETRTIRVKAGKPDQSHVDCRFAPEALGYAEITITADRPFFRKILTEHMYSIVERPDGGTFIVNAAFKFSDPVTINLMRRIGKFCLVHPAHCVAKARNIGNSALIVNPFEGPVAARLATRTGKEIRRRLAPHQAALIPLEELIDDDRISCVLYTGSNRYPGWDVRHAFGDANRINRIDHLEFFRGDPTIRHLSTKQYVRAALRNTARNLGLRN